MFTSIELFNNAELTKYLAVDEILWLEQSTEVKAVTKQPAQEY